MNVIPNLHILQGQGVAEDEQALAACGIGIYLAGRALGPLQLKSYVQLWEELGDWNIMYEKVGYLK